MRYRNRLKKTDIRIFIVPFIIITLTFFTIGYFTIKKIEESYYSKIKQNSIELAKNYSYNLSKSAKAASVVNELFEDRLLEASKTIVSGNKYSSNDELKALAENLEVDVIYYYNSQGKIIYSNTGKFVGWKAYEGHPVYNFMNSQQRSLVEGIRQDNVTKMYYKYAYLKDSNGGFVQIGVSAQKIHSFLGSFETQRLLNEMKDVGDIDKISFIDNNLKISQSTDSKKVGQEIIDQDIKNAINEDRNYSYVDNVNGENEYRVFAPVYLEREKIGTLAIEKSLKYTEEVVRNVAVVGVSTLLIIYISLLYTMYFIHKKNNKLIQMAYYDLLTGLPNRQYLKEFLTEEIERNKDENKSVLIISCRDFRTINMTYGLEYGDEILKRLSKEIYEIVDNNKKLFRFSAGRFILYVKNYKDRKELISIANQISQIADKPLKVNNGEQHIGVQIGIVEINSKYDNFDKILKDTLISLDHIKNNHSANYIFFNELMENKLQREDLIEREIRNALSEENTEKIYLQYHPLVDSKTNKIVAFEALARMKTESLGFVSPMEFIEVAERKQLITPLGNFILKKACSFINNIISQGHSDVKVAINISGIQLLSKDFTDTVINTIKENNIDESNLELEITESILLDNYDIINKKLKSLREQKITISLDDFGTGYSSFSRLGELNIDTVKIDKHFISKISTEEQKELITGDIISMSHKLGLKVVAEGVELESQKGFLVKNNCDVMQGYLFSKPLMEDDAIKLLNMK